MFITLSLCICSPKPPPADGAKSNPSKRHRDRLNGELDKLTSLLPFTEQVRARLDKLSVLRLSVGYLKVKSFFSASMKKGQNSSSWTSERSLMFGGNLQNVLTPSSTSSPSFFPSQVTSFDGVSFSEGDLLLQALNGFVLVVTSEGHVFYTSPTIQDFLGFHQSDVIHQSVFELIHTDDRAVFRQQLHFALNPNSSQHDGSAESSSISSSVGTYDPQNIPPENSSFLERNFSCRFRCLLDNSSGFLALNFHGRLKFLNGQNRVSEDGTLVHPQLALFSILIVFRAISVTHIQFVCFHRGKVILGYNEVEICTKGSGYSFIHAADMMYCADNHIKMIKTGESGLTTFRLLSKTGVWLWVQANARLVFKGGRPDFIIARQRALTNEEGEEHLRLRHLQVPFNFATGEAQLYDIIPTVDVPDMCSAPKQRKLDNHSVSYNSLLGCMLRQDQSIYCEHNSANTFNSLSDAAFRDTHATVSVPGDAWQHSSPKPAVGSLANSDTTVQDMIETLQQILGDSDLTETLDVESDELKSWESILLKMSTNSSDMSNELDDILNNDILTYVEEQLQKEGGLKLLSQLDDVPASLSTLDLQNQGSGQGGAQNFNWPLEPQNQLIPAGQMMTRQLTPGLGTMKLTHMDRPQLSSSGLNGLTLQEITSQPTLSLSVGLGNTGAPLAFNPSLANSCAQTQNQLRTSQVNAQDTNLGVFRQTSQHHSNQLAQPTQNHLQMKTPSFPVGLQDQSAGQFNHGFNIQDNQWNSSVQADNFVQTYAQNISNEPSFIASPLSSSCLQGGFALQTQGNDNQRQSWPLEQQQQQLISNGPQQMVACLNQMSGSQTNPVPGVTAPQSAVGGRPMYRASFSFSSCMFTNATPSMPLCQRTNLASSQMPSKPCFYQGLPGSGSVKEITVIPNPNETALSCQMTTGLDPNSLLVQQQSYLNFSEQTQINSRPVVGNEGFPFPSLPSGNPYYSENK
uniref:Aryl hydrocarbon receptor 2 n=1 Tax=Monopterus albus TaxID=43700 RepID=A0A3Q3QCI8_MONAL